MKQREELQPDRLDLELEASLQRLFAPPASLDTLARRLPVRSPGRFPPRLSWVPFATFVASAAAAVVILLWGQRPPEAAPFEGSAPLLASLTPPAESRLPPVGPLSEAVPQPGVVRSADLATLYHAMAATRSEQAQMSCGPEDRLAETLARTYGQPVQMRPEASGLLHGPFASAEWPTGTILTGYPDQRTSVLVAESDATLTCCLSMELPADSGLRMFVRQVGGLILTEITPLEEPRLLQCFE